MLFYVFIKVFQKNGPKGIGFDAFELGFELGGAIWNYQILHFRSSGESGARAWNPSIQYFFALFSSPLERRIGRSSGVICLTLERTSSVRRAEISPNQYYYSTLERES